MSDRENVRKASERNFKNEKKDKLLEQEFKRYQKKNDYLMLILAFPSLNGTGV